MPRRFRPNRRMRTPYRSTKRYGKKYGRKRFNRRFVKTSGTAFQNIKSTMIPKNMNVKLRTVLSYSTDTSLFNRFAFGGNTMFPYPTIQGGTGTYSGSAFYDLNLQTGDATSSGAPIWGQFYDSYYSHGSAIKVTLLNANTIGNNSVLRMVLVPVNNKVLPDTLNALTYQQLAAYPAAKFYSIGPSQGGPNRKTIKMFRKTKSMIGIKDVRDDEDLEALMPKPGTLDNSFASAGHPTDGFYYFLKLFPDAGDADNVYNLDVTIDGYFSLNDRVFNGLPTVTVAAP